MKHSFYLAPILLAGALGGCASPPVEKSDKAQAEVDRQIMDASRKIERMQLQLVQAGALNQTPRTIPVAALGEDQAISISWRGDAYQLLAKLASDRRLEFESIGVRLPLPVAIKIQDQSFDAVLDAIRAQTGYRADVLKSGGKLTLRFNRPQEVKS